MLHTISILFTPRHVHTHCAPYELQPTYPNPISTPCLYPNCSPKALTLTMGPGAVFSAIVKLYWPASEFLHCEERTGIRGAREAQSQSPTGAGSESLCSRIRNMCCMSDSHVFDPSDAATCCNINDNGNNNDNSNDNNDNSNGNIIGKSWSALSWWFGLRNGHLIGICCTGETKKATSTTAEHKDIGVQQYNDGYSTPYTVSCVYMIGL